MNIRAELLARGLAPRTATLYTRVITRADEWCQQGGSSLAAVPVPVLMEWVHAQPRSFSTRKMIRNAIHHYWQIVERPDRPQQAIKLPPRPRMVCRALEPGDADQLARAAYARHDDPGLSVLLGLYLAFRREETAKVTWEDFRPDWSEVYVIGKNAVSAWVPVHPHLGVYLQSWPRRSRFVFASPNPHRAHVHPETIWQWCRDVSTAAGMAPVSPHVLRHTALAQANDATRDLRAVQHFARHADPHVTSGYTRVTGARLHAVVMSLNFAQPRSVRSERGSPTAEDDGGLRLAA